MQTTRTRLILDKENKPALRPHIHLRYDDKRQAWAVLAPEHVYWPDDISVAILQKLDGARTIARIITDLAKEYDAPEDAIEADVMEFLQTWADERLVKEGDA